MHVQIWVRFQTGRLGHNHGNRSVETTPTLYASLEGETAGSGLGVRVAAVEETIRREQ